MLYKNALNLVNVFITLPSIKLGGGGTSEDNFFVSHLTLNVQQKSKI